MESIAANVPLHEYCSWKVGGPAEYFAEPHDIASLDHAQQWALDRNLPIAVLGSGSNVLISDQGIKGLVICMRSFRGSEIREEGGQLFIVTFAGTPKSEIMRIFTKYRLAPALFLAGLPGDMGGGVVMNAGVGSHIQPMGGSFTSR